MKKSFSVLYGIVCYAVFFISFLYAIGFVGNIVVPKPIDSGSGSSIIQALIVNMVLLGLFAIQHTIIARPAFKAWWTKINPAHLERSTFVLVASLLLILLYWQWRPMTAVIWSVGNPVGKAVLLVVFWLGWCVVLLSTNPLSFCKNRGKLWRRLESACRKSSRRSIWMDLQPRL